MIPLCEKYRASCFADLKDQEMAISSIKAFFRNFPFKKSLLIHGPAGTGKTSLAFALAKEMNLEIFELNASDLRDKEKLEQILKPASQQNTLFAKKGKVILIDEVDGLSVDRGGLPELIALIEKTAYPIIITANNIWQQKFNLLRQKAELLKLKEVRPSSIFNILKNISEKEGKNISDEIIKTISIKCGGDVRAALNDLQTVMDVEVDSRVLDEREKEEDIFKTMRKLFKTQAGEDILKIYDSLDMSIDDIFLWIEENIPYEYHGEELAKAYNSLSKADVFRGRIHRQQHWRFLVYENFLLSLGISSVREKPTKLSEFTIYQRPKRILKIWMHNQKYSKKKSIAAKFAKFAHISQKRAMRDFFLLPRIINKESSKKLDLSEEEQEFLKEMKQN